MDYVEARIAEQNHLKYGWPIPPHLADALERHSRGPSTPTSTNVNTSIGHAPNPSPAAAKPDARMAAGMGKLQEIDLGPEATERNIKLTEQAWRRMEGQADTAPEEETAGKRKPRRWQKRRNSEDKRRDMMVEAVLRESKRKYFSVLIPRISSVG